MKGGKEGTCWVVMKQNPQGPEMRSSKAGMLSGFLTGTIVSPTDHTGFYLHTVNMPQLRCTFVPSLLPPLCFAVKSVKLTRR